MRKGETTGLAMFNMDGQSVCMYCWSRNFEKDASGQFSRRVAYTELGQGKTKVQVSTVLIGVDMSFHDGPPVIFETMIFAVDLDDEEKTDYSDVYCERYPTKEAAQAGHDRAVEWAKQNLFLQDSEIFEVTE